MPIIVVPIILDSKSDDLSSDSSSDLNDISCKECCITIACCPCLPFLLCLNVILDRITKRNEAKQILSIAP
jgi:hypothetical protein